MGRTLGVLGCSGCGAPLALGAGDEAVCSACGRATPIPAEHRALRDAAGFDAQARAEAEAALHSFDRPPGLFMRAVAAIAGLPFAAVFILFGAPLFFVDLGLAVGLARWVSRLLGWPAGGIDDMSITLVTACMGAVLWGMTIVPAFLAAYGGRRVTVKTAIGFGLWALAMYDFSRAGSGDEAPGLGIAALVVLTFFLIYLVGSAGGSDEG